MSYSGVERGLLSGVPYPLKGRMAGAADIVIGREPRAEESKALGIGGVAEWAGYTVRFGLCRLLALVDILIVCGVRRHEASPELEL